MWSWSLAFHITWFTRVTLSLALFLVVVIRRVHEQFPLFAAFCGWIAAAGTTLIAMNYAPMVSGEAYFVGVAISNGVSAALAFAIIYRMFMQKLRQFPMIGKLGKTAFRVATLILVVVAMAFAWLAPGLGPNYLTSQFAVVERTVRILQCGQLIFLFLFFAYFRLPWRSRTFGIGLGLGIWSSANLAVNAIRSQAPLGTAWRPLTYSLNMASDTTQILAMSVWLFYVLAEDAHPGVDPPADDQFPDHDLGNWNRELDRMLEP